MLQALQRRLRPHCINGSAHPTVTALLLLTWICAALAIELAAGMAVVLVRRNRRIALAVTQPAAPTAARSTASTALAWPLWREFRVARREFEDAVQSQCSFYLESVDGVALPEFKPGQYLTFALDVAGSTDALTPPRQVIRCYSLSDRPHAHQYRITVKRVAPPPGAPSVQPGVASNHWHDRVHAGDVVRVKAPSGHFFIDPDDPAAPVLIAGGIGITPLLSMLNWWLAERPGRPIHLYYGLRHSREQAFRSWLAQQAAAHPHFHLTVACSRPDSADEPGRDFQHLGHVDVELLRRTLPAGRHCFYVCGPPAMLASVLPALRDWGVAAEDIRHEAFGPGASAAASVPLSDASLATAASFEVRFARSGRTLTWDARDANLLAFAERHAVAVDSGCRAGSCGACETRLIDGQVAYAEPPDHDIAPGHCLLCVGTPRSALVIDA
jgi:ferredoxin-NADP reductase